MILSRAPLRITIGGGGTDLPSYYSKHTGRVASLAINKYIYIALKENIFDDAIRLHYSINEIVDDIKDLKNARVRECLNLFKTSKIEIHSIADLPSNSGLGSSGAFLVSLILALSKFQNIKMNKFDIAEMACDIEINKLKEPVGKQDQYIACFGGASIFSIEKNGKVSVSSLSNSAKSIENFFNLVSIYEIGHFRNASHILKDQNECSNKIENILKNIQKIGNKFIEYFENEQYEQYGKLLHDYWGLKKELSSKISNKFIDEIYNDLFKQNLILGGKILGAGGGGYLFVFRNCEEKYLDNFVKNKYNLSSLKVGADFDGTQNISF